MSWHVLCPDEFVRPENDGIVEYDHGAQMTADARDAQKPAPSCCGRLGHTVQQGLRLPTPEDSNEKDDSNGC